MSNQIRRPTVRHFVRRQNATSSSVFLSPPPLPSASITSNSRRNIEHGSANTSQNGTNKRKKQNTNETDEHQVVPNSNRRGTTLPVVEQNGFDDYYRNRVDAPIFRYSSSNNQPNKDKTRNDRQTIQTNLNGSIQNNPIVIVVD